MTFDLRSVLDISSLWMAVTFGAYSLALWLAAKTGNHVLANPIAIAIAIIIAGLLVSGQTYAVYAKSTLPITFLIGPATVALVMPIWINRHRIKRAWLPIAVSLFAGSVTAIASTYFIARLLGGTHMVLASLVPKSSTAPVAMLIAGKIGGSPVLAMTIVLITGMIGSALIAPSAKWIGVKDERSIGFSAGLASHNFGIIKALSISPTAGAFAVIGMTLNAVMTAIILSFWVVLGL